MENIVHIFIRGLLEKNMELRKYSLDPKTAFHLNLKLNNTLYFITISIIQFIIMVSAFFFSTKYFAFTTLIVISLLFHLLVLCGQWIDIKNAKNHYAHLVNILPEYIIAYLLAIINIILMYVLVQQKIGALTVILSGLAFYFFESLCYLTVEARIKKKIAKNMVSVLNEEEEAIIKVKTSTSEETYLMKDYYAYKGKKRFIIMKRDFHIAKTFQFQDTEYQIGNSKPFSKFQSKEVKKS